MLCSFELTAFGPVGECALEVTFRVLIQGVKCVG
jgi:hypothetical protein